MQEIGYLLCSGTEAKKAIKVTRIAQILHLTKCLIFVFFLNTLQNSLSTLQNEVCGLDQNEASFPFKVCGMFLDALFKHSEMAVYSPLKDNEEGSLTQLAHVCWPTSCSTHSVEVLHSAPDFSQAELISVIAKIYDGRIPQPFEFFRCHENTTMQQLKLFITRANSHPLTFVILGVNLLPTKLQEVCV